MDLFSYLLGKKSSGGGGTGPTIEINNPLNTTGLFHSNITKIGDFTFEGTSCQSMFTGYSSLTDVDFSNFTTANVTTYKYMFNNCSSLTKLDLSSFETSAITDFSYMFNGCTNLKEINLRNLKTTQNIATASYTVDMFKNCNSLEKIDLRSFDFTKLYAEGSGATPLSNFFAYSTFSTTNCLVIVKNDEQKQYIQNNCSWMNNVKTVEEYEEQPT